MAGLDVRLVMGEQPTEREWLEGLRYEDKFPEQQLQRGDRVLVHDHGVGEETLHGEVIADSDVEDYYWIRLLDTDEEVEVERNAIEVL